jgi:signal transduction histidine kinase/CheY-like chemotaxis protein
MALTQSCYTLRSLAMLTLVTVGHSVIPRDVACCEVTVNLPAFDASAHGNYRDSVFVVDDLTLHPDLKNRVYVTGFPNGRYYAGVPITSSSGINIGAYCILDDKPRVGISDQDLTFLKDMSATVMTHLETIRALSEREQNNQMVAGLGDFVRNAPDSQYKGNSQHEALSATNMPLKSASGDRDTTREFAYSIPKALADNAVSPLPQTPISSQHNYFDRLQVPDQQGRQHGASELSMPAPKAGPPSPSDDLAKALLRSSPEPRSPQHSRESSVSAGDPSGNQTTPPRRELIDNDQSTYQRAAGIMCQSLNIDGVAFIDMSISSFGGLVQANDTTTEDSSVNSESAQESTGARPIKSCKVLGCAEALVDGKAVSAGADEIQPAKSLTENFIRRLLNRHPSGKIWTFGENLLTHSEDGYSTDNASGDNDEMVRPQTPTTKERKTSRRQRRSDGESLQRAFPGARCIALHGIWDHGRHRWSVAGLYWTFDPLRVLSPETEMHFVIAFSDIVVAETRRLEAHTADKSKSDFISSVSHELRSPLHGILGSVEILTSEKLDNTAATLVEQIGSCGQSLLEIIDHLLDFSNLRQQNLTKGAVKSSKIGRKFLPTTADISENDLASMKTGVALDDLTEDTVVSSVYSFFYDHNTQNHIRTSVILDIERSDNIAWHCQLATGGWKRIVINLVTNALKYTPAGFVRVSLRRKVKPGPRRRFDAVLSVTDSGKGMSQDFQKNRLFQDFSQEDTLSNGLGLGLHMVSRMVNAMGGTVDVTSDQKGSGTRVTVTVPLEHHPDFNGSADKGTSLLYRSMTDIVKVGFLAVDKASPLTRNDRLAATSWTMAIASVEKNLRFLGLQPEMCHLEDAKLYDLRIVLDIDLERCLDAMQDKRNGISYADMALTLVVCHNSPSAQKLRRAWPETFLSKKVAVDFIALPCGVKQLARAVTYTRNLRQELRDQATDSQDSSLAIEDESVATGNTDTSNIESEGHKSTELSSQHPPVYEEPDGNQSEMDVPSPSASNGHSDPRERRLSMATALTLLPKKSTPPETSQDADAKPLLVGPSVTDPSVPSLPPVSEKPVLLLVDDNRINLQLLVAFAKTNKYRHIAALDGKIALDAFETSHRDSLQPSGSDVVDAAGAAAAVLGIPTVILMDINMPVMDGYEAAQRIRAYENKHNMKPAKIFAVTALQSEAAQTEAFGSGFDMFLSKPIKLKSLAKLIQDG